MATSNYVGFGTLTANGDTDEVSCRGWSTLSAHADTAGGATLTWQFKGADGVFRNILGTSSSTTALAFTASNMVNVYFGTDVKIKGVLTSGTNPVWDWQIMGNPSNRHS